MRSLEARRRSPQAEVLARIGPLEDLLRKNSDLFIAQTARTDQASRSRIDKILQQGRSLYRAVKVLLKESGEPQGLVRADRIFEQLELLEKGKGFYTNIDFFEVHQLDEIAQEQIAPIRIHSALALRALLFRRRLGESAQDMKPITITDLIQLRFSGVHSASPNQRWTIGQSRDEFFEDIFQNEARSMQSARKQHEGAIWRYHSLHELARLIYESPEQLQELANFEKLNELSRNELQLGKGILTIFAETRRLWRASFPDFGDSETLDLPICFGKLGRPTQTDQIRNQIITAISRLGEIIRQH